MHSRKWQDRDDDRFAALGRERRQARPSPALECNDVTFRVSPASPEAMPQRSYAGRHKTGTSLPAASWEEISSGSDEEKGPCRAASTAVQRRAVGVSRAQPSRPSGSGRTHGDVSGWSETAAFCPRKDEATASWAAAPTKNAGPLTWAANSSLGLTWKSVKALPEGMLELLGGNPSSVQQLLLTGNELCYLDRRMFCCSSLTRLDLSRNRVRTLPPGHALRGLSALTDLNLRHNRIEDPASLGTMTRLTSLDLSDNRLCAIPTSLRELGSLIALRAANNRISHAQVPKEVLLLPHLQVLDLSGNPLLSLPDVVTLKVIPNMAYFRSEEYFEDSARLALGEMYYAVETMLLPANRPPKGWVPTHRWQADVAAFLDLLLLLPVELRFEIYPHAIPYRPKGMLRRADLALTRTAEAVWFDI